MLWTVVWAAFLGVMRWLQWPQVAELACAAYFAAIFAIKVLWGYKRGRLVVYLTLGALSVAGFASLFMSALVKGIDDVLLISLWSLVVCLSAFLPLFYGFFLINVVANVVDWVDDVIRNAKPGKRNPPSSEGEEQCGV